MALLAVFAVATRRRGAGARDRRTERRPEEKLGPGAEPSSQQPARGSGSHRSHRSHCRAAEVIPSFNA